jgi:hypothetical protein
LIAAMNLVWRVALVLPAYNGACMLSVGHRRSPVLRITVNRSGYAQRYRWLVRLNMMSPSDAGVCAAAGFCLCVENLGDWGGAKFHGESHIRPNQL